MNIDQSDSNESIVVAIRVRPLSTKELSQGQSAVYECVPMYNAITQVKDGKHMSGQTYHYDKVFGDSSTTSDVYSSVAKDIVRNVTDGINGTIFACKFLSF